MKNTILTLILLLTTLVTKEARAAFPSTTVRYPVTPLSGSYYDPESSGTGWFIDVGRVRTDGSAFFFGANFTYVIDGRPTWVVLQGDFTSSTELVRQTTGVIGHAVGQMYEGANGQCFGCAKKLATITASSLGVVDITWRNTDRADFTFNGVTTKLTRLVYGDAQSTQEKALVGRWRWTAVQDFPNNATFGQENQFATVEFRKRPASKRVYFYPVGALDFAVDDATTAEQYTLVCGNAVCPFGPKNGLQNPSDPDIDFTASNTVIVRQPNGDLRVVAFSFSPTVADTVGGAAITRFPVNATGSTNLSMYLISATSDQFTVRVTTGTGTDPGIYQEYLFTRIKDNVLPHEDFQ